MPVSASPFQIVSTLANGAPGSTLTLNQESVTQYHTLSHFSALFLFLTPVDDSIRKWGDLFHTTLHIDHSISR